MGITIKISACGKGVEFAYFGSVHGNEILLKLEQIYSAKSTIEYIIVNKSQCTEYNVTADEILLISELDIQAAKINPNIMIAIIESRFLQFSLTEAWHAYVEDHIANIQSFNSHHAAINWIKDNFEPT